MHSWFLVQTVDSLCATVNIVVFPVDRTETTGAEMSDL